MRSRPSRALGAGVVAVAITLACARERHIGLGTPVSPVPPEVVRGIELAVVARGLDKPVALAYAAADPSRRLFVVEKTGRIRILKDGRVLLEPFLDLSKRVSKGIEQGLLGLAFHPDYAQNGRLFVNYTDHAGDTRVVELIVASPKADRATVSRERELLHVVQPYSNHNGGNLAFGPDSRLYVGLGDGGSANDPKGNAQNGSTLLGKMLRLDVNAKAADGKAAPEIVAKGLRNPWRYSFDRESQDLYIADVGQNGWEEVDVVPLARLSGANFGWNVMEGLHCFHTLTCSREGLTLPVVEYGHDAGCSITGGIVYLGKALPRLRGLYFYSDYCTAFLRSFRFQGQGRPPADSWVWSGALDPRASLSEVSAFAEDENGEMYILSLRGTIWTLRPTPAAK